MNFIIKAIRLKKLKKIHYAPVPQGDNKSDKVYNNYEDANTAAKQLNESNNG